MKKNVFISLICLSGLLFSCSIGKRLESPVYVYIDGVNNIEQKFKSDKYMNHYTHDQYFKNFKKELEAELKTYNLIAVYAAPNKTEKCFKIEIQSLSMHETYEPKELPADENSNKTKVYNITTCSVDAEYRIFKSSPNGWIFMRDKSAAASKVEKVNQNRTAAQILAGTNKDNTIYTYHELDLYIFNDLLRKTARNIAELSSLSIQKETKQWNY